MRETTFEKKNETNQNKNKNHWEEPVFNNRLKLKHSTLLAGSFIIHLKAKIGIKFGFSNFPQILIHEETFNVVKKPQSVPFFFAKEIKSNLFSSQSKYPVSIFFIGLKKLPQRSAHLLIVHIVLVLPIAP
jgi:hypothetical protein